MNFMKYTNNKLSVFGRLEAAHQRIGADIYTEYKLNIMVKIK